MDTTSFASIFSASGPFATVLTDISHDDEHGEQAHALRVRDACRELIDQGAGGRVVEAVSTRLGQVVHRPTPVARLVVANADGVLYDDVAGVRVDRAVATWGALPDLATWFEHLDSRVTFVLALVDHEGGDVAVMDSDVPEAETSIRGDREHVHKVPVGGWSALRYQRVTENVWAENAEAVAQQITSRVRQGHRLVLLAGDPRSKSLVREALGDLPLDLVELESGGRAQDGGDQALQQSVREALMDQVVLRRLALVHELRERLGRDDAVATGARDVADALVRGQVDTLLVDPAPAAELEIDPARHPGLALGEAGVDGPVRADQALVAAAVLTDASIACLPESAMGGAPVAALLRWNQEPAG